ncbi:MAG: hypothetical protein SPJ92_01275 [Bariatricus sp.]|nr:hypothetical protein [Bariatricus sp.]
MKHISIQEAAQYYIERKEKWNRANRKYHMLGNQQWYFLYSKHLR